MIVHVQYVYIHGMFSLSGEADLVVHHLKALVGAGLSSTQLAVIAPYSLQVCIIIIIYIL